MEGKHWTIAWLVVQSLLLISAMCGMQFTTFHCILAGACLLYNFMVYRAVRRRK